MNIPNKFWNAAMAALGILTIFLLVLVAKEIKAIRYVGSNPNMSNLITVSGSGEATAKPDIATFSFGVIETAKTVAEAQTAATNRINAALKVLRDAGIEEKDIQTVGYGINPHYEYQNSVCTQYSCPPSRSILTGYDVTQNISVKVRDLAKAGEIFTSIGSIGVQNINSLSFGLDKPEAMEAEARSEAITEAQEKAKVLADQLDVSIVRLVSFSETDSFPRPLAYGLGGAADAVNQTKVAPEIPAGEHKVIRHVTITYEIK